MPQGRCNHLARTTLIVNGVAAELSIKGPLLKEGKVIKSTETCVIAVDALDRPAAFASEAGAPGDSGIVLFKKDSSRSYGMDVEFGAAAIAFAGAVCDYGPLYGKDITAVVGAMDILKWLEEETGKDLTFACAD